MFFGKLKGSYRKGILIFVSMLYRLYALHFPVASAAVARYVAMYWSYTI